MAAFSNLKDARVMELAMKLEDASSVRLIGVHSIKALLPAKHVIEPNIGDIRLG